MMHGSIIERRTGLPVIRQTCTSFIYACMLRLNIRIQLFFAGGVR